MSRIAPVAVVAAVVAAVLAGCGGPTQVGSAMIVGDHGVALADVQTRIDTALQNKAGLSTSSGEQVGDTDVARYVVSREVRHELLTTAAARAGVTVDEAQVDAAVADTGDQGLQLDRALFTGADLRDRARDRLLAIGLAQRQIDGLAVTVDLAGATSQVEAEEKARTIAAGGPAAAAILADRQNAQREVTYRAATDPDTATTIVFGLPPGGTATFEAASGQGFWLVVHVRDRTTDAPSGAAPASVDADTLAAIGIRIAQFDGGPVQVNPRFGVWDEIRMQVVPAGQSTGTVLPPAAG